MNLSKHRIGHSRLSNKVYLYRHGKDANLALAQRDALNEVLTAAALYLMDPQHPSGAVRMEIDGRVLQLTGADVTDVAAPAAHSPVIGGESSRDATLPLPSKDQETET